MQENIQSYIPSDLKFSSSKLYFQNQKIHTKYIFIKKSNHLYHKSLQKFAKFFILEYNKDDISYLP